MTNSRSGGVSPPRPEYHKRLIGKAAFIADIDRPGMVHAAFVRSDLAHSTVRSIDVKEASSAPGVIGTFVSGDLGNLKLGAPQRPEGPITGMARPILASDRVRYVGEPLAIVVAETKPEAEDAVRLVDVELDPLDPVLDMDEAHHAGELLFPDVGSNIAFTSEISGTPPPDHGVSITITVENQRVNPVPLDPLGIVVEPDAEGSLVVWCGTQTPHRFRDGLADVLHIDSDRVRVITPEVGGAVGLKSGVFPEYAAVAAGALRLGRPVAWSASRREQFLSGAHARAMRHVVTLRGTEDGQITSAKLSILADAGAYPHRGFFIPLSAQALATGPYDIGAVEVATVYVVTNRAPMGPYRGAGRPEATYALERAIDVFAHRIGMDPAEMRRINLVKADQMPYTTATGLTLDIGNYRVALDRALELADYSGVRHAQNAPSANRRLGVGVASFIESTGGLSELEEFARVELRADGISLFTGSTSSGQGHESVFGSVLGGVFDVDSDQVIVVAGDTQTVASGTGTFGSRSAQIGGVAAWRMAVAVREAARRHAASMLEAAADDIELSGGVFRVAGVPGTEVTIWDVAHHAGEAGIDLAMEEVYVPSSEAFTYGSCVAVVEVDVDSGDVAVLRLASTIDCGNVLDEATVRGQIVGSLCQGLGQALVEEIIYDEHGQPLTTSLMDYPLLTADQMPAMPLDLFETPAPGNPLGVKGVGESGCIGAPPAVVNAVLDALHGIGVTHLDMPLRP